MRRYRVSTSNLQIIKVGTNFINLAQVTSVRLTQDQVVILFTGDDDRLTYSRDTEGVEFLINTLEHLSGETQTRISAP